MQIGGHLALLERYTAWIFMPIMLIDPNYLAKRLASMLMVV